MPQRKSSRRLRHGSAAALSKAKSAERVNASATQHRAKQFAQSAVSSVDTIGPTLAFLCISATVLFSPRGGFRLRPTSAKVEAGALALVPNFGWSSRYTDPLGDQSSGSLRYRADLDKRRPARSLSLDLSVDSRRGRTWPRTRVSAPKSARFASPVPRIEPAIGLAQRGAASAIDISDGLVADLAHVAAASKVCIQIDVERLPRVDGVSSVEAANSGEEYEIVVTAPELDVGGFISEFGLDLTEIGRVVAGSPGVDLLQNGKRISAPPGFDHFRDR